MASLRFEGDYPDVCRDDEDEPFGCPCCNHDDCQCEFAPMSDGRYLCLVCNVVM